MLGWFRRRRRETAPGPLSGAPEVRRVKTYSAETGQVYEYVYEGRRATREGVEYVFSVSTGQAAAFPVAVAIADSGIEAWETAHGRELSDTERYGIAKIALRRAFDEYDEPARLGRGMRVGAEDVEKIAAELDLN